MKLIKSILVASSIVSILIGCGSIGTSTPENNYELVDIKVNGDITEYKGININGSLLIPSEVFTELSTIGAKLDESDNSISLNFTSSPKESLLKLVELMNERAELNKELETLRAENAEFAFKQMGIDGTDVVIGHGFEPTKPGSAWGVIEGKSYTVHYPPNLKKDAEQAREHLDYAINAIYNEFTGYENKLDKYFNSASYNVFIHREVNTLANLGLWTMSMWDNYNAELHFLGQEVLKEKGWTCCTGSTAPFDDIFFLRTTLHEYFTLPIHYLINTKTVGWNDYYTMPRWFEEGISDWYGEYYGKPENWPTSISKRHDSLGFNKRRYQTKQSVFFGDNQIKVDEVYGDGLLVVAFLYETYGKEKIHQLLLSEEKTFDEAFRKVYGQYEDLEKPFRDWVSK